MNKLKAARLARGLSQLDLTQKTGISPQTISQMENEKIYPYPGWRKKLSKALGVSEKELFPEVDEPCAT